MLAVSPPSSVSSKAAPDKSIMITMTGDGKVFLTLGDETKKNAIIEDFNTTKGLQLSAAEMDKLKKSEFIGFLRIRLKSCMASNMVIPPDKMAGIPITDSTKNELADWMRSVTNAYAGGRSAKILKKCFW